MTISPKVAMICSIRFNRLRVCYSVIVPSLLNYQQAGILFFEDADLSSCRTASRFRQLLVFTVSAKVSKNSTAVVRS